MFGKLWEMKKMYDKYKQLQNALKKLVIRSKEGKFQDGDEEKSQILVDISGEMKVQDVQIIDTGLLDPSKKKDLEWLLMKAIQKAQTKAQEVVQEKTKEILWFDPSDMAWMMWGGWIPWMN